MKRTVICGDAFELLKKLKPVKALITSLPDASELRFGLTDYEDWFTRGACLCLQTVAENGVAIFYQGDRKHHGVVLSKSTLLCNAAEALGRRLLWHKIVLRNPVGSVNLFRPSYLHMMAFSKLIRSGKPTADVVDVGTTLSRNAMNIPATAMAVRFAVEMASAGTIYDPFCGQGTVLAVANALGYNSVGYDIDEEKCSYARGLVLKVD